MKSRYLAKNASRRRGQPVARDPASLPAPVGGWSTALPLSEPRPVGTPPTAAILENWRPTTTGVTLRGGSRTHATVSLLGDDVVSLMSYNGSETQKRLFAATASKIFDVTAPPSAIVEPAPSVTGQKSGYWSFVNFTTSGSPFLLAVNGTDDALVYDPVDKWRPLNANSVPAITGVATSALSFVWVHRNRLFFVEKNTLRARYLKQINGVAGDVGLIDLNGIFQRGGSLLFGATWSVDAGDGLDDKCVFVTTEGEVAIFSGANPSISTDWSLAGRYDIGRPLGSRATMRAGGDLIIATEDGLVPLSAAIDKDISALNFGAISKPIAPDWQKEAASRSDLPWEVVKWPAKSYAIVTAPASAPSHDRIALVVNTLTGAWCKYTGWDARCAILHDDQLYFGTSDGRVKRAEVGGNDDGAGIYYTLVSNPEHLGARGVSKTIRQARAVYSSRTPFVDQVSASMNYVVAIPSPPGTVDQPPGNEWDVGKWDQAKWDAPAPPLVVQARWVSIGLTGHVMQWQVQVTGALASTPDTELISLDVSFELGGVIV